MSTDPLDRFPPEDARNAFVRALLRTWESYQETPHADAHVCVILLDFADLYHRGDKCDVSTMSDKERSVVGEAFFSAAQAAFDADSGTLSDAIKHVVLETEADRILPVDLR